MKTQWYNADGQMISEQDAQNINKERSKAMAQNDLAEKARKTAYDDEFKKNNAQASNLLSGYASRVQNAEASGLYMKEKNEINDFLSKNGKYSTVTDRNGNTQLVWRGVGHDGKRIKGVLKTVEGKGYSVDDIMNGKKDMRVISELTAEQSGHAYGMLFGKQSSVAMTSQEKAAQKEYNTYVGNLKKSGWEPTGGWADNQKKVDVTKAPTAKFDFTKDSPSPIAAAMIKDHQEQLAERRNRELAKGSLKYAGKYGRKVTRFDEQIKQNDETIKGLDSEITTNAAEVEHAKVEREGAMNTLKDDVRKIIEKDSARWAGSKDMTPEQLKEHRKGLLREYIASNPELSARYNSWKDLKTAHNEASTKQKILEASKSGYTARGKDLAYDRAEAKKKADYYMDDYMSRNKRSAEYTMKRRGK